MAQLSISEVARQLGMRASAIRYYEQIGVLRPARRVSGQRRYDLSAVQRLAVVRLAQDAGFSLTEIRNLFFGFQESDPVSARWQALAENKRRELDETIEKIRMMKDLLRRIQERCQCETIEQCGARILQRSAPKDSERQRIGKPGSGLRPRTSV